MTSHLSALLLTVIAVILPLRYGCSDIVGGHCMRAHSQPFMAAIQRKNTTFCGGVLVEKQLKKTDIVVLGAHLPSKAEKEQQRFKIKHLFSYPQLDRDSKENDIMLLKLDRMATLNKNVKLLSLPDSGKVIKPGTKCNVISWEETSPGKPLKCLQNATVEIVNRNIYKRKCNKNQKLLNVTRNVCARGKMRFSKRDACKDDSGGPLICGRKYSGIVSFGEKCGRGDKLGVYIQLTKKYIEWIKKTIYLNREA